MKIKLENIVRLEQILKEMTTLCEETKKIMKDIGDKERIKSMEEHWDVSKMLNETCRTDDSMEQAIDSLKKEFLKEGGIIPPKNPKTVGRSRIKKNKKNSDHNGNSFIRPWARKRANSLIKALSS